ncbi:hypothetical protein DM02DRAFT_703444 [Periconia macrospinosa]|uniref:Zn(2)-C6 fungal-type domain-containing protein n=1 Tax=Periconia macrospinosa TaxID=97972 RepID=A0A2V1ECP1_9PLEO|nr:hypothetical protein DM02DRAFT_703444 [Periconia macrospinosa]
MPRPSAGSGTDDKSKQRRAHRKSRYGCKTCKKRRIKCDERKPECANCVARQIRCDYLPAASPNFTKTVDDTRTKIHGGATSTSGSLDITDLELMYHWTTSTCNTLVATSAGTLFWKHDVTETGLAHTYVLHLILAIAALHLAHSRPAQREEYSSKANDHYSVALPLLTKELSTLSEDNCDAVILAERMLNFITWGRGPQPGEFLAFGNGGRSEWLTLFRGIRTTAEALEDRFVASKMVAPSISRKGKPLALDPPFEYKQALAELRDYITHNSSPSLLSDNIESYDILSNCYHNRYEGIDCEYHMAFAWLYKMKEDFINAMQRHESIPLVIYAHFVVLMGDLERFWYMKGWTSHVMGGIWEVMREEDRIYIRWPCSVLGWIPPS